MDLSGLDSNFSYLYGWYAGDGGLYNDTRNRGRLSTEVSISDRDIIEKLKNIFDSVNINSFIRTRTRNTNYKSNYESITLVVHSFEFRKWMMDCGFKEGDKHLTISPPLIPFDKKSFARGYIDANGSFCIGKNNNIPILSICLSSEEMYLFFVKMLKEVCNKEIHLTRNKRDGVYNFQITRKHTISFIKWLEYENINEISLDRKRKVALELVDKFKEIYE